jgi:hypothetical protein
MAIKELFQDSRPQVLLDPRASQRIDPRFKFTRAGTASYYDSQGVVRYAPANQPRLDHAPATGEELGLLMEEARTNRIKSSNNFIFNDWHFTQCQMTPNAVAAPDGTQTAALIQQTNGTSTRQFICTSYSVPSTGSPWTASVYVKQFNYDYVIFGAGDEDSGSRGGRFGFLQAQLRFQFSTKTLTVNPSTNWGGAVTGSGYEELPNGWFRLWVSKASFPRANYWGIAVQETLTGGSEINGDLNLVTGNGSSGVYFWGMQWESGASRTSYIPTTSSTVTRPAALLSIDTDIPSSGSLYIDAQALDTRINTTLLSAANAANDKLLLQVQRHANLYGSTGLVYSVDGAFKPTLPFPVPGTTRERNLITWGANNYHYRADSARKTASSAASVPANMTELGIGHDVTDPTKGFTGYINTVYMWPGEITPTVAEALVSGDIDLKDADVDPVPANTLAFIFNTQSNRQVILPLRGSTNNVLVDWGDDTSSALVGAAASVNVTKTYSAPGIYSVQLTANADGANEALQNLEFFGNSPNDLFRVQKWGGTAVFRPTTMLRVFRDCTQLDFEDAARTELPDTSAITNWQEAFYNCNKISGTFPTFNTTAATTFSNTWFGCSSMTAFPFIESASVTSFSNAWQNCSSLTSFPAINTAAGTNFTRAWQGCSSLTSFPLINTASVTNFFAAWLSCSSLTSFPLINTAAGTNFSNAWQNCTSLTSFPLINTAAGTSFFQAWQTCSSLTSFPLINTAAGTNFLQAWSNCSSLTSFPLINTAAGTSFSSAWQGCSSLTSFPLINTAAATNLSSAWSGCTSLTSFPLINTAAGTNFQSAWNGCSSLTSFPLINTAAGTNFQQAWNGCSSLADFPAAMFNSCQATNFSAAWQSCALTAQSIENILVSINTANTSNGNLTLSGGTNANSSTWSTAANNAYIALVSRGWTITQNGTAPS